MFGEVRILLACVRVLVCRHPKRQTDGRADGPWKPTKTIR